MNEFSNESAFKSASKIAEQIKSIEGNETLEDVISRVERISAAMELDLNSMYDSLNVAIDMITDPQARRAVEDIRDEVYRCMK